MNVKTSLAAAALLASLSTPALAGEPCTVCGDPTWPELATPAPATSLRASGERAAILSDPSAPQMAYAAPAASLVAHAAEGPIYRPAIGEEPAVHFALVPDAPTAAVATR